MDPAILAALDHGTAPELAANLASLWGFVAERLTAANLQCDAKPIGEAEPIITMLREAFASAAGLR